MMNEENMDDETPQTARSESAFFGTSDEIRQQPTHVAPHKLESNVLFLTGRENQIFRASRYGHATALLIPLRLLPKHLGRNDVLEVRLFRIDEPTKPHQLYTTHKPGYARAYLDLAQLGANHGDQYEVSEVKLYRPPEFAAQYNDSKPEGLENTELIWGSEGFAMKADGVEVPMKKASFRTYQGMVVLDAEIGGAGAIKIQKKMDGFEVRLKDHSPVTGLRWQGGGLLLTYVRTGHEARPHTRTVIRPPAQVEIEPPPPPSKGNIGLKILETPTASHPPYLVEVDMPTLIRLSRELGSVKDLDDYKETKGRLAEEIVKVALPQLRMRLIADHPKTPLWWATTSKRPGPDLLVREEIGGGLHYVECKWWGQTSNAIRDATHQVLDDLRRFPDHSGEVVVGAYVAVLEWELQTPRLELHLRRVA